VLLLFGWTGVKEKGKFNQGYFPETLYTFLSPWEGMNVAFIESWPENYLLVLHPLKVHLH
jgi:hypothetical protein